MVVVVCLVDGRQMCSGRDFWRHLSPDGYDSSISTCCPNVSLTLRCSWKFLRISSIPQPIPHHCRRYCTPTLSTLAPSQGFLHTKACREQISVHGRRQCQWLIPFCPLASCTAVKSPLYVQLSYTGSCYPRRGMQLPRTFPMASRYLNSVHWSLRWTPSFRTSWWVGRAVFPLSCFTSLQIRDLVHSGNVEVHRSGQQFWCMLCVLLG